MTRRVLEINGLELIAADRERVLLRSPAVVTCHPGADAGDVLVGTAAAGQARINPRATHDRFWSWLDDAPMARPAPPARSHADLAWLHLREVVAEVGRHSPGWLVAVPAGYDERALGLLLGIARRLEIGVDALVAAPVAAAAAAEAKRDTIVIDAFRYNFSADRVVFDSNHWQLEKLRILEGGGLGALTDAWARLVADAFVAQTRLDPAHDAAVEQALYDRLPEWLERLRTGDRTEAVLPVGGQRYRAELERAPFARAAEPFVEALEKEIERAGDVAVVVRHRLARLTGFERLIAAGAPGRPSVLDETALSAEILARQEALADRDGEGVLHVVRVPADRSAPPTAGTGSAAEPGLARLHVLIGDRAVAVPDTSEAPLELPGAGGANLHLDASGRAVVECGDASGVTVNGEPATGRVEVQAGDRVAVDGESYVLLRVDRR